MLMQAAPAETFGYMVFGLGVILGTMLLYLISLRARVGNLERDLQVLDEVESQQDQED